VTLLNALREISRGGLPGSFRVRNSTSNARSRGSVHNDIVSFDVYLQDFSDEQPDRSESVGRRIIGPLLDARGHNVITADGSAAVYGAGDVPLNGLMFNHIDGELAWDVIFEAAVEGEWVIMPIGGPVCIVREEDADTVPEELRAVGLVVVRSGAELRRAATDIDV
jgi:hypothetical protein